jgi:hypothetical protein
MEKSCQFEHEPKIFLVHFSLLANEIMWNVIRGFVQTLPKEYREAEDKYIKSSSGMTIPRWRTCNHFTDGLFQYVTTLLYVNRHLSEDARNTVRFDVSLHNS